MLYIYINKCVTFYRPVNLIHETKDRWVYAATFGALTGQFISFVLNGSGLESTGYLDSIWRGDLYTSVS